jgi:2-C-methyl-D-erythritol 2,4-cyclodiphosphate synthase
VTLVAQEPKLRPYYALLKKSLAEAFRLDPAQVNLKAKSNEGLDAVGRGEAIACYAVATLALRV